MKLQEFIDAVFPILNLDPSEGMLWVQGAHTIHNLTMGSEVPLHTLFFPSVCLLMMGLSNKPICLDRVENIICWEHPHPHPFKYEDGAKEIHFLSRAILSSLDSEGTVSLEKVYGVMLNLSRIAALDGESLSSLADKVAYTLVSANAGSQVVPNYNTDVANEEGTDTHP